MIQETTLAKSLQIVSVCPSAFLLQMQLSIRDNIGMTAVHDSTIQTEKNDPLVPVAPLPIHRRA